MYPLNIDIVQQLLSNNSLNISEVAYSLGFKDPKYFSRRFKQIAGVSPKEYRELIKARTLSSGHKDGDKHFLQKAIVTLETKMSDGNISFDDFACEMNVSKASLYRKIKSIAGLSPSKFIRSVRISQSAQLLVKHRNITDVAFAVGYNDSKYFSRCFKQEFGVSPKEYQETHVSLIGSR